MKVVNQVKKFIRETRGHQLNVTIAEAQLLHDFAIWLDRQSAQQSFAPDSLKAVVKSLPKSPKTGKPLLAKSG